MCDVMSVAVFDAEQMERRRAQNRAAQRRFRRRHQRKKTNSVLIDVYSIPETFPPSPSSHDISPPGSLCSIASAPSPGEAFCSSGTDYGSTLLLDDMGPIDPDGVCMSDADTSALISFALASAGHEAIDSVFDDYVLYETTSRPNEPVGDQFGAVPPRRHSLIRSSPTAGWMCALHMAAQKGHSEIARVLLEHSIDCEEKDSDGLTSLIHATIEGHDEAAKLLISYGARVGNVDDHGRSALHWAVIHRRESSLKVLIEHCAVESTLLNGYDNDGMTPLHIAIDTNYEVGVRTLLQSGANVHYRARKLENKTT